MLRGSYQNGFAPRDGMPLHPSLWQGCELAWAPCLGPTGLTLRDWIATKNNGTLINSPVWAPNQGRYALTFNGSNNEIRAERTLVTITGSVFVGMWVNVTSSIADAAFFTTRNVLTGASRNGIALYWRDGSTDNVAFEVVHSGTRHTAKYTITLATNTWYFVWGQRYIETGEVKVGVWGYGEATAGTTTTSAITHEVSPTVGGFRDWNHIPGFIDDTRLNLRTVSQNEIALLAHRRGIAYDMMPMTMPYSAAGFQAAWALRQRLILGGGGGLG